MKKLREKVNIFIAKSPRKAVLVGIMIFNLLFVLIAAGVIAILSHQLNGLKECSFWQAIYYTITMILDAGCIDNLVTDAESAGFFATFICIGVAVIGMILFTGAVIGYATNCISDFIESKNNGKNKLILSDHIVMINWNSKGTEIMSGFLCSGQAITVVVFVPGYMDKIEEEIRNCLDASLAQQAQKVYEEAEKLPPSQKKKYLKENLPKEKITYIVREGDVASSSDLDNICISSARTVIILDDESYVEKVKGNMQTIKTLIQVSEISKGNSRQAILVEVNDEWTEDLVNSIVEYKRNDDKEKIYRIPFNRMMGKTNAQIAIDPEFNGMSAIDRRTGMKTDMGLNITPSSTFRERNIVIIGHNSNMDSLMKWLDRYRVMLHQKDGSEVLNIAVLDDAGNLARHDYYRVYPYVVTFDEDIYDGVAVEKKICELFGGVVRPTTALILSDDQAGMKDIDANVFTHLIYLRQHIRQMEMENKDYSRDMYTIIAEVLNPKNEDIVKNYGADRVIVNGRYQSRIVAQISLDDALCELYEDILA